MPLSSSFPGRGSALKCVGSCLFVCMCLTGAVAAVCPDPGGGRWRCVIGWVGRRCPRLPPASSAPPGRLLPRPESWRWVAQPENHLLLRWWPPASVALPTHTHTHKHHWNSNTFEVFLHLNYHLEDKTMLTRLQDWKAAAFTNVIETGVLGWWKIKGPWVLLALVWAGLRFWVFSENSIRLLFHLLSRQWTSLFQLPVGPPASFPQPLWTLYQTSDVSAETEEKLRHLRYRKHVVHRKNLIKSTRQGRGEGVTSETSSRIRPKVDALSVRSSLTCLDTSSLCVISSPASNLA